MPKRSEAAVSRRDPTAWKIARGRYEEWLVTGVVGVLLFAATILPLGSAIVGARPDFGEDHPPLRALSYFVDSIGLLLGSVALSMSVTLLAGVIGIPLGVLLAKTDLRGRSGALVVHAFPLFLPPYLLALGWFYLFGEEGALGSSATATLLFSPLGAIVVMGLAFAPIFTCLTMLGLAALDPTLEEAARLVARPIRVLQRIVLPAAWHAEVLAALVTFTLAFSEIGVPMFLRIRAYPVAIFTRLGGIDYAPGEAALLTFPLLGVALALLVLERGLLGRRSFTVIGLRGREGVPLTAIGRWRPLAMIAVWGVAALSLLPMAGLFAQASRGGFLLVPQWIGRSLATSLMTAAIAAVSVGVLGAILGRQVARARPGAWLADGMAVLAFVTPAPLLGIGLIGLWNRPATSFVYATVGIIVLGYVARYSAIGIRTVASTIAQTSPSLEEAAAVAGATYFRRLLRIVLPTSARGLAAGTLLTFVFCLRDLETAVLYYPPGGEPLPVRILTLEANGPEPVVAALALIHVAATVVVVAAGAALLFRRPRR